jgi:CRP-like cAMP-binding protein
MADMFTYARALKQSHLFRGLEDAQLTWILQLFEEHPCAEETQLFTQRDIGDQFYYVVRGKVRCNVREKGGQVRSLGTAGPNDYFGEGTLLRRGPRGFNATAEAGTLLLQMNTANFRKLTREYPALEKRFKFVSEGRKQASRQHFAWLAENETVYFLSRKNRFVLYRMLLIPLVVLAGVLLGMGLLLRSGTELISMGLIALLPLALSVAWVVWRYVDWGNDFYIITNRRVVWLEKVVGLYDSRSEAELRNVMSVDMQTSAIGRIFDFGDVIIRTYTGEVTFRDINSPRLAESMVKEYWERARGETDLESGDEMRKDLRKSLNPPPAPVPTPQEKKKKKKTPAAPATGLQPLYFEHFLRMQFQGEGVTTYRKHVWILIRNSLLPLVAVAGYTFALWWLAVQLSLAMILIIALGYGGIVLWWVYVYVDWANDLYLITSDQVIDIYRKPLGRERRQAAPLENILAVEFRRRGIISQIFNFGTVFVTVGDRQLDFVDVFNPPMVQQELVNRMNQRIAKKREADAADERKRMLDWLSAYDEVHAEMRQNEGRPRAE